MRTDATTARLVADEVNRRRATSCIDKSVQSIRPIEAWPLEEDARRLRGHLVRCEEIDSGVYPLLGAFIQTKLADAVIGDPQQVGPDIATGYSRVIYAVDGLAPQSQVLSRWRYPVTGGFGLSICTLLGATLLGMKAGQRSLLLRADGTTGWSSSSGLLIEPRLCSGGLRGSRRALHPQPRREEALPHRADLVLDLALLPARGRRAGPPLLRHCSE